MDKKRKNIFLSFLFSTTKSHCLKHCRRLNQARERCFLQSEAETPLTISGCLDIFKLVQIFLFSKTQICTLHVSRFTIDTFSVQICVLERRKIWTHLRKSVQTKFVWGFQLRVLSSLDAIVCNPSLSYMILP